MCRIFSSWRASLSGLAALLASLWCPFARSINGMGCRAKDKTGQTGLVGFAAFRAVFTFSALDLVCFLVAIIASYVGDGGQAGVTTPVVASAALNAAPMPCAMQYKRNCEGLRMTTHSVHGS